MGGGARTSCAPPPAHLGPRAHRYDDDALPVTHLLVSHLPSHVPKCAHSFDVRSLAVLQVPDVSHTCPSHTRALRDTPPPPPRQPFVLCIDPRLASS